MSGRAFGNRFTFLWPTAKIAVMGPKQIAGVMSQVRRGQAARAGVEFDEEADAEVVAAVERIQEAGSLAHTFIAGVSLGQFVQVFAVTIDTATLTMTGLLIGLVHMAPERRV